MCIDADTRAKVLFVDDERINLLFFESFFRKHFDVRIAPSAEEALELLSTDTFDVIVTDQKMYSMNGVELLETECVVSHPCLKIILTGYGGNADVRDALSRGVVDVVLSKPLDTLELVDLIISYRKGSSTESKA